MNVLHRYWALMMVNLKKCMAYRFSLFTSFLADVVKTLVMLAVWIAVYQQRSTIEGFNYPMMITYLLVSQTLNNIYGYHNAAERLITGKIEKGTIGFELLRPVRFTTARLAENMGQTVVQLIFAGIMMFGFKCFIPELSFPASMEHGILFVVSAFVGFFIMFSVSLASGLLSFWTMSSWGLRNAKNAIVSFFSGALIPIALLPSWLQEIVNVLPFKSIIYVPTMIYMGQYSLKTAAMSLIVQILWAVVLWMINKVLFGIAIRKVSINGG